jgi:eukaryotic-like serine/threonine-protein kinase
MRTKRSRTLFLVVIALLPLILASCVSGRTQLARGWSGTAIHDGVVYVGTTDGRVVAVAITGNQKWPDPIVVDDPPVAIYTTPAVYGDIVCVGSYAVRNGKASGRVYALNTDSGVVAWEYPRRPQYIGAIVGSPVVDNDTIYLSSSDSTVYALNTTDGRLVWKTEILDGKGKSLEKLWTSLAVHDGRLYVSTFDGQIHVLSAQTGALLNVAFTAETGFTPSPVVHDDVIYVGSFDNNLYAIRVDEGELLWRFAGGKWFWAAPSVSEGVVYAGCLDGRLYAIDAETGEALWQFETGGASGRPCP